MQGGADSVDVPLKLKLPIPNQFVSVLAVPGRAPRYTMQLAGFGSSGYIEIVPDPLRPGSMLKYANRHAGGMNCTFFDGST